jgi:8-oxo-dGTP pyrophosphatase MutT (NUDIX family)
MRFIDHLNAANRHRLANYRPFFVGRFHQGWVRPELDETLLRWPELFTVADGRVSFDALDRGRSGLPKPATESWDALTARRTHAMARVLDVLRREGRFPGWRDELYAVNTVWGTTQHMQIERAAVPTFGLTGYGVHVNGYVREGDQLSMWVGRRAMSKSSAPGALDHIVAGGQPADMSLMDNVVKECFEEAGIPAELARRARPCGYVSYVCEVSDGIRPDVLFVYDLDLPRDFEPRNTDGEVDAFYLWSIEEVVARIEAGTEFKFNCTLVIIDFLVRHGYLSPDSPEYVAIVRMLRYRETIAPYRELAPDPDPWGDLSHSAV